jgi:hypothetical protein
VEVNSIVIGMAYNHHRHTKTSCFPKSAKADKSSNDFNKQKRKHVCKANCKCRYRMPRARQQCTAIQESTTVPVKWYSWDGTATNHHVMEVIVKRHPYNAFQNVCCRDAINAALFQERCESLYNEIGTTADLIMIYSNKIEVQNGSGTYVPFKNCKTFWEGCGEDNIKTGEFQGRMDPVLRLYCSC